MCQKGLRGCLLDRWEAPTSDCRGWTAFGIPGGLHTPGAIGNHKKDASVFVSSHEASVTGPGAQLQGTFAVLVRKKFQEYTAILNQIFVSGLPEASCLHEALQGFDGSFHVVAVNSLSWPQPIQSQFTQNLQKLKQGRLLRSKWHESFAHHQQLL